MPPRRNDALEGPSEVQGKPDVQAPSEAVRAVHILVVFVVEEVLDRLQTDGLLDEGRFLDSFIRTRIGRGQGPARIQAELGQRGIDRSRVQAWLREAEFNWPSLAAGVREKRFGSDRPESFEERVRQAKFLEYRGFDSEQINAALELAGESD